MNQLRTKYYDFSAAMLMGSNEVPTNNSTAMGTATLKFNNTTKKFQQHDNIYYIGHIHRAAGWAWFFHSLLL
jgi:hypothetical protein